VLVQVERLDVHKNSVVACVLITTPDGRVDRHVRTFKTMTADLLALGDWLNGLGVTQANARLVDYEATLELARHWRGGEVASADGLRFVVPIRTLNAGHNPNYFGVGRGVTY
jgi:Tn3 transposase DDE domain